MNLSFATKAIGAAKLALKAKAPTLMVVGGVGAMGVGTVLAAKQTLKIDEVLEQHVNKLDDVKKGEGLELASYGKEVAFQDRLKIYSHASLDLGKLYAVPGVVWLCGAGLVFGGHNIMVKRNATLALAFTALKESFDNYRARVVQLKGDEYDQYFMNGGNKVVNEAGELVGTVERDWDQSSLDPYNRVFEQGATSSWQPDLGVNKIFVQQQRKYAQELLNRRGYLYLSEVYTALGFDESDISRVVGWKVKRLPDGSKDIPIVDFGLDKPLPDDWKYSREKAIYLDFNCQGLIVGGKLQKILEKA